MGFLGYFFLTYFGAMILKIANVPGFKDISWGWFIIAPIVVPIFRLLFMGISWIFYLALGVCTIMLACKLLMWVF